MLFVACICRDNMRVVRTLAIAKTYTSPPDEMIACQLHAGYIPTKDLGTLLADLYPPMGVHGLPNPRSAISRIILSVDIPDREGHRIHFMEVLHALAGRLAGGWGRYTTTTIGFSSTT